MSLTKTLRKDAEATLHDLVMQVQEHALKLADKNGLEPAWLLRLAIDGRTASLHKKVVGILAKSMEQNLLVHYETTHTTVTDIAAAK